MTDGCGSSLLMQRLYIPEQQAIVGVESNTEWDITAYLDTNLL